MASSSTKKGKGKSSQITIQITGKGSEAYKDVDWKTLSDEEAKAIEKESSLAWKVLSNTQTQSLQELSIEDVEKKLAEIMELTNSEIDLAESVLLDYYASGFWWAREQGFTTQQLSGFFSLLHQLLQNIKERRLSLPDNLTEFRKILVGIGTNNDTPCQGLDFFDLEHAKAITDFMQNTLFQHHRMHEFLFHSERKEEIVGTELVVETLPAATVPYLPPLDEGLNEEVYLKHVAPAPPTPSPEPQAQGGDEGEAAGVNEGMPVIEQEGDVSSRSQENLLSDVTAEDVKTMFDRVSKEMFADLQSEISDKLAEREAEIIGRINKIHRVADEV